jgi:hypothetical protein
MFRSLDGAGHPVYIRLMSNAPQNNPNSLRETNREFLSARPRFLYTHEQPSGTVDRYVGASGIYYDVYPSGCAYAVALK